jgi:pyruvate/2-oxoglutarate dehydrogenase complex dihydrolipoamide dehydrogenase (E3) component
VSRKGKGKRIVFMRGQRREEIVVDEILYAMGRAPALEGLTLGHAGLELKHGRLRVNDEQATAVPHIFGVGDTVGPYEVVHIAIQQGEIAARNAVNLLRGSHLVPEKMDYRLKTLVTFTDPEVALVGLTETEARERGVDILTASYPFNDHGKAMIGGHEFGFVKLIAVMRYRGTAEELAKMPHYHPTLAEILTYPAEEIADQIEPACVPEHVLKHV